MSQYFTDPLTSTRMQLGKWYLCGDSGYTHTDKAFDTDAAAVAWWVDGGDKQAEWPGESVYIPPYSVDECAWGEGIGEAVVCLRADDILHFCRSESYTELELDLSNTP